MWVPEIEKLMTFSGKAGSNCSNAIEFVPLFVRWSPSQALFLLSIPLFSWV